MGEKINKKKISRFIRCKETFIKILKIIINIIWRIIVGIAIINFVVIPFLHNVINHTIAQWIWYISCAVFLLLLLMGSKDEKTFENPLMDKISDIGIFWILPILPSAFVFNYYDIDYIWLWVIFAYVFILIPFSFISLLVFKLKEEKCSQEEKQKATLNVVKSMILYWLVDLLYMSIFNDCLILTFIFGILAVLIVSFNLVDAFLNGIKNLRFFIALELVIALIVCVYLIYIIPNDSVQNIVLTITAALIGGVFTLLGVAWTIKKGDADRKKDLWRMEEERKEEERKKCVPYVKFANEIQAWHSASVEEFRDLEFDVNEHISKIQNDTFYVIKINMFTIKNVSPSNIILKGIFINNVFHQFSHNVLVESNGVCQVHLGINHWFYFPEKVSTIKLLVTDILYNEYVVPCEFYEDFDKTERKENHNDVEYTVQCCEYTIESISLPKLLISEE